MTGKELAMRALAIRVVKDILTQADTETRKALQAAILAEDARGWEPKVDGRPVGTVTPRKGATRVTASVVDEHALASWCKKHAPHMLTETVRTSDQKALLEQAKAHGGLLDKEAGTVTEIDGIEVSESRGEPGLTVTLSKDADALIREALASGALRLSELTALPEATS